MGSKKTKFGQSIWDNVRCYWELEERVENTLGTTKIQHLFTLPKRHLPPNKNGGVLLSTCPFLIGWEEFLFPIVVIVYLGPLASGKSMNCEGHGAIMRWAICLVVCLMARANCRASGCCCVGGHSFASGCLRFIRVMFSHA
jgi:hypothetical protein